MKDIQCQEVIITDLKVKGKGTEFDPYRKVTQVYTKEGKLIAEHDPCSILFTKDQMIDFAHWVGDRKKEEASMEDLIEWQNTTWQPLKD